MHEHDCNCGCEENEDLMITLELEDNTEVECVVLSIFPVDDKQYIALLPTDTDMDDDEGEVYLYRYSEDADGQPILGNIETDEEYEAVADKFDEILDEAEFDEIVDGEEE